MTRAVTWWLVLALAGCGSEAGTPGGDGGAPSDAGSMVSMDAGVPVGADGGRPHGADAGTRPPPPATEPETVAGCGDSTRYALPEDTAAPGPWPVGARTARVMGLTVEVFYPARFGSADGVERARYDMREALPESQRGAIPDADNPWQDCDCYRDLPLDEDRGPFPVVVFIHGTAGFRTQSLTHVTHWASRGFVVVTADHPGLWLADSLALACPDMGGSRDLGGDVDRVLGALEDPSGDLAFLGGRIDLTRIGMVGHSAGGSAVAELADRPGVRVVIPMAAGAEVARGPDFGSALFLGGTGDSVVRYRETVSGYEGTSGAKRLVGLDNAGHLAFSDLCETRNDAGQDIVEIAQEHDVCGVAFAGFLFDCDESYLPAAQAWDIVNDASAAALEEGLWCDDAAGARLASIESRHPGVSEYRESL